MIERDIPSNERHRFFAMLSRGHHGAMVDLRVGGEDEVLAQPFSGISADGEDLIVHVGSGPGRPHHGHRVTHVNNLRLVETDDGAASILAIGSDDGMWTELTFRSPVREELLDPLVE